MTDNVGILNGIGDLGLADGLLSTDLPSVLLQYGILRFLNDKVLVYHYLLEQADFTVLLELVSRQFSSQLSTYPSFTLIGTI